LLLRNCGGGITAWKGTNTSFPNKYGVYVHKSQVLKADSSLSITGKCSLGRPWNDKHRSIFSESYLDESIRSSGYTNWSSNDKRANHDTMMGEYRNSGPGYSEKGRKEGKIAHILSDAEFEGYSTPNKVFQFPFEGRFGNTPWIDANPSG
jgi:Pectinesterase